MSRGHLNSGSHSGFSFSLQDPPGVPVLNWSTTGGDFRVAHFLGIHALQILPIAGWLIDRLKALPRRAKPTAFVAVSAGYVFLMGFVFMQAMNGVPLVRM